MADEGWTLNTLKVLMDERDIRYSERSDLQQRAIDLAEANAERWRSNANEWRQAMTDKDRNFVTKNALWGYIVGAISLTLMLVTILQKTFQ